MTKTLADATVELGELALLLGLTDRSSLHADGKTFESVADHTVMLTLVACSLAEIYARDLDQGLIAIFCSVHDAVEGYAEDTSTLRLLDEAALADKAKRERLAAERIEKKFADTLPWLAFYIDQYERRTTSAARWVKAVDKLVVKITHILNRCAAPLRDGMTLDELTARYDAQYQELFGPDGYARDFHALSVLYRELVGRELAIFAERLAEQASAAAAAMDATEPERWKLAQELARVTGITDDTCHGRCEDLRDWFARETRGLMDPDEAHNVLDMLLNRLAADAGTGLAERGLNTP